MVPQGTVWRLGVEDPNAAAEAGDKDRLTPKVPRALNSGSSAGLPVGA